MYLLATITERILMNVMNILTLQYLIMLPDERRKLEATVDLTHESMYDCQHHYSRNQSVQTYSPN